jgi:D-3-phosphoglycerate dehydrogenase
MRIAVIHDYADVFRTTAAFGRLGNHEVIVHSDAYNDSARVVEQVKGCEAVLLTQQRVPFPRAVIEQLPELKFVCQTGPNASHLDIAACTDHGVVVSLGHHSKDLTEAGGYSVTAELAWGLILASLRHLPFEAGRLKQGHWQSTVGTRLFGRTLGIYALGHIGGALARVGRAFGMRIVCWGREASLARAKAAGFDCAESRKAFFEASDIVSLHLPAHPSTRGIVTAEDLGRMKTTALLVNTSRASIIEDGALVAALKAGRPGFAAIDVYEQEPVVGAGHPLLALDNAFCTPHLGYAERDSYEGMYATAVDHLLAFASGRPVAVVNPEVLAKAST